VAAWELRRFGPATKTLDRISYRDLSTDQRRLLDEAKQCLHFPPVHLTDRQIDVVASGFEMAVARFGIAIWKCSILPEHVHMVLARHRYKVEQVVNLLKGEATKALKKAGCHPLGTYRLPNGKTPTPWAKKLWKQFLDSHDAIVNAMRYVRENPEREGRPQQHWCFVTPYAGLDEGCVSIDT
jgi:REP element-mobilizing transposase RayT